MQQEKGSFRNLSAGHCQHGEQLGMVERCWQYLENLKALWYGGAQRTELRKADEVKVERVSQITL